MNKPKNRYLIGARITTREFRQILRYFCHDETATKAAIYTGVNRNTVNRIYVLLRRRIVELSIREGQESGEFEIDESYFGARRVRGKRGRGAAGKTPVFGVLKRGGKVYVNIVKNCTKAQLLPILQGKAVQGSTIYSDGWKAYDGLILNGYDHYRVHHHENEFARGKNHINGIESFWSYAKRRLRKFNGVSPETFNLHLKETEFRWNHRSSDMYTLLLRHLRKSPLS